MDDQGRVRKRWVRLGHGDGATPEILSGLEGGETIIVSSDQPLVEGDKVVR